MKNLEIIAIVDNYTAMRNAAAKARQEGKDDPEIKLPAPIAWKQRVNMDKLFHTRGIIQEALKEIYEKYTDETHGEEPEEGKPRVPKPEYMDAFLKEQNEILKQDTDVEIRKVKVEDLGTVGLTSSEMDTLYFMIEE